MKRKNQRMAEMILCLWILIVVVVWAALDMNSMVQSNRYLPQSIKVSFAKGQEIIWPYVFREYIYAEKESNRKR